MRFLACLAPLFALLLTSTHANTEKVIFIAPASGNVPISNTHFDVSRLGKLTPSHTTLRTSLPVAFPTNDQPRGIESWYFLSGLKAGQRHEVRVCWAAIQPTNFWLDIYEVQDVVHTPGLFQSLSRFSEIKRDFAATEHKEDRGQESVLILRIQAAADFYTTNKTLMQHPPAVHVDIILDPYIANAFPTSLLPTAGYILVLVVGSWYFSGAIWEFLKRTTTKEHID